MTSYGHIPKSVVCSLKECAGGYSRDTSEQISYSLRPSTEANRELELEQSSHVIATVSSQSSPITQRSQKQMSFACYLKCSEGYVLASDSRTTIGVSPNITHLDNFQKIIHLPLSGFDIAAVGQNILKNGISIPMALYALDAQLAGRDSISAAALISDTLAPALSENLHANICVARISPDGSRSVDAAFANFTNSGPQSPATEAGICWYSSPDSRLDIVRKLYVDVDDSNNAVPSNSLHVDTLLFSLQDAAEFATHLVRTYIDAYRFANFVEQSVGGPIQLIAARYDGFRIERNIPPAPPLA